MLNDKRAMACGERCLRQPSRRYGFHSHGFTNWWQPDKERLRCRLMRRFGIGTVSSARWTPLPATGHPLVPACGHN